MTEWSSNILAQDAGGAQPASSPTIEFQDASLVDRYRKGDMQAFGLLVAKYQDGILNLIFRLCGNRSDAEELAQETFLKAMERIHQFRGQSQFYTWLFRIGANLAISHRRRGGRIKFHSISGPEDGDNGSVGLLGTLADRRDAPPHAGLMSVETQGIVMGALEQLDEESRLVVVLRDVEDMDYQQIADVLEVPVGTVKSRLHRARSVLREKLSDLMT